jgi:hypothetical protein
MTRIFEDTLKSPNGKWSRKSLTLFVSFIISIVLGFYIVTSDFILKREINKYSIEVFNSFMLLTGALSGITVADKFTPNKNNTKEDE